LLHKAFSSDTSITSGTRTFFRDACELRQRVISQLIPSADWKRLLQHIALYGKDLHTLWDGWWSLSGNNAVIELLGFLMSEPSNDGRKWSYQFEESRFGRFMLVYATRETAAIESPVPQRVVNMELASQTPPNSPLTLGQDCVSLEPGMPAVPMLPLSPDTDFSPISEEPAMSLPQWCVIEVIDGEWIVRALSAHIVQH
jgi:hypothetical protein